MFALFETVKSLRRGVDVGNVTNSSCTAGPCNANATNASDRSCSDKKDVICCLITVGLKRIRFVSSRLSSGYFLYARKTNCFSLSAEALAEEDNQQHVTASEEKVIETNLCASAGIGHIVYSPGNKAIFTF